jgi:antitoxin PrlF
VANSNDMAILVQITPRGTVTLPKLVRKKAGLQAGDQLAAEITPDGILLRPVAAFPIEIYTDERIQEFRAAEKEIEDCRFK